AATAGGRHRLDARDRVPQPEPSPHRPARRPLRQREGRAVTTLRAAGAPAGRVLPGSRRPRAPAPLRHRRLGRPVLVGRRSRAPRTAAGRLAEALLLRRPAPVVFALRLARDLREHRKPPLTLLRRGWSLARAQAADVTRWQAAGMRPTGLHQGTRWLQRLAGSAEAEQHHHHAPARLPVLEITAVCFLRDGAQGTEVLAVRKRGTGSYMQVGGKLEPGESARDAAVREVEEELGVSLDPAELAPLGEFEAVAANEPGTMVRST